MRKEKQNHSASSARDDYAVESLAGDIAAVADRLKLKRFVLVGHSMGGAVSLALRGHAPGASRGACPRGRARKNSGRASATGNVILLHELAPELPHKLVTGTSHWLHMDKPEEFNRILDEFLKDIVKNSE